MMNRRLWSSIAIVSLTFAMAQGAGSRRASAAAVPNCASKCIAMEYEVWFPGIDDNRKSSLWASRWGTPLLGTYASTEPRVIDRHAEWFADIGVDVVIIDWSNSSQNFVAGDKSVDVHSRANTDALFAEYRKLAAAGKPVPRIAILVGAFDEGAVKQRQVITSGALQNEVDYIFDTYVKTYPDLYYAWDGKPLLLVDTLFNGDPGWRDARFATRLMSATLESQKAIFDHPDANAFWSWYDRDPIPSHRDGVVESATVTQAYPGNGGWADARAIPPWDPRPAQGRSGVGGRSTFEIQWDKAIGFKPKIIVLNQWNEFQGASSPADDEYTPNLSNDIEPTVEFGCAPMEAVRAAVAKWKGVRVGAAPPGCH